MADTAVIVVVVEDYHHEHQHEDNLVSQDGVADAGQLGDQCVLDKIRQRSKFQDLDDFHSRGSVAFSLNKAINTRSLQSAESHSLCSRKIVDNLRAIGQN